MSKYVIGCDPDSDKHGIATYEDGKLVRLDSMTLMQLFTYITNLNECHCKFGESIEFHIEDVCAQNAAFNKGGVKNAKAGTAINRSIGKCQQAQIEAERMLEHVGIQVTKHKISKSWKNAAGKKQFEKITGWTGRSNEDTRSAAYFGYLGL